MNFITAYNKALKNAKKHNTVCYVCAISYDAENNAEYTWTFTRECAIRNTIDYIYTAIWGAENVSHVSLTSSQLNDNVHFKKAQEERRHTDLVC